MYVFVCVGMKMTIKLSINKIRIVIYRLPYFFQIISNGAFKCLQSYYEYRNLNIEIINEKKTFSRNSIHRFEKRNRGIQVYTQIFIIMKILTVLTK